LASRSEPNGGGDRRGCDVDNQAGHQIRTGPPIGQDGPVLTITLPDADVRARLADLVEAPGSGQESFRLVPWDLRSPLDGVDPAEVDAVVVAHYLTEQ